jgi:hypothetical protein
MDFWTGASLDGIVRFLSWDDARVARYLDISISDVRKARRRMPKGRRGDRPDVGEPIGHDTFATDAQRGSQRLAEALANYRGPSC